MHLIFFFWLFPRTAILAKSRIITGIAYGIFVWAVMNLIVLPLSNTPPLTRNTGNVIKAILILIVMMGIPLSFIARKCYSRKETEVEKIS